MIVSAGLLLAELIALFLTVSFAVELAQRRLGPERLRAWMGGRPVVAALKGIVVGFVTPFCTYSAVPVLVGLRRAEVPAAGYVAFIVAAPVLDPVLFGALVLIVGLEVAVMYLVVAFAASLTLALIADRVGIERFMKPIPASGIPVAVSAASNSLWGPGADCATVDDHPWQGLRRESRRAGRSAASLSRSFGPVLVLGVAIGIAIESLVSPDTVASITGRNSDLAVLIAAGLGTPLYVSTELFVPIADSLHAAGVGAGAIVALTIAGAGANVPEFILLGRLARARIVSILFGYVFAIAVIGGLLAGLIAG